MADANGQQSPRVMTKLRTVTNEKCVSDGGTTSTDFAPVAVGATSGTGEDYSSNRVEIKSKRRKMISSLLRKVARKTNDMKMRHRREVNGLFEDSNSWRG